MQLRIILADDHVLFRESLRELLIASGFDVVGLAGTGVEAIEETQRLSPDLVLMDLDMPEMGGLEATRLLKAELPDLPIVILTASELEINLFEAVKAGAMGYVLKTMRPDELISQIEAASRGEAALSADLANKILLEFARVSAEIDSRSAHGSKPEVRVVPQEDLDQADLLSARENDVLNELVAGKSNKEIASALIVSENTIKFHLKSILRKLHLNNRAQVISFALRHRLTDPRDSRGLKEGDRV